MSSQGKKEIFALGQDKDLHHQSLTDERGWVLQDPLKGPISSPPSVVAIYDDNTIPPTNPPIPHMYAREDNGELFHWWLPTNDPKDLQKEELQGNRSLITQPFGNDRISIPNRRHHIFAISHTNGLMHWWYPSEPRDPNDPNVPTSVGGTLLQLL